MEKFTKSSILITLFVSLAFSTAGCGNEISSSAADFFRGVLANCGENTIFLNLWFGVGEDKTKTNVDPIGGYLYLYWIDDQGQICHGEPGVNGQPGPAVLIAWTDESYLAIEDGSIITEDQLTDMQTIHFDGENYDGTGLHFAQVAIWKWRASETGIGFSDPGSNFYSIPEVVNVDGEFCLMPVMAKNYSECLMGAGLQPPDPSSFLEESGSEPGVCQTRVQPVSLNMTIEERVSFCLTR